MLTRLLLTMLVVFIAVLAASALLPGVRVRRPGTAVIVALVFGVLNLLLSWFVTAVLAVALLPVAVVTLGIVYLALHFLVNCVLLWATDKLVADFEISNIWSLLGTSALLSVSGWLVARLL